MFLFGRYKCGFEGPAEARASHQSKCTERMVVCPLKCGKGDLSLKVMASHFTAKHSLRFTSDVLSAERSFVGSDGSLEVRGYCSSGRKLILLCSTKVSEWGLVSCAFVCVVLDDDDFPPDAGVELAEQTEATATCRPVTVSVPLTPYLDGRHLLKFGQTAKRWPGRWCVRYNVLVCYFYRSALSHFFCIIRKKAPFG